MCAMGFDAGHLRFSTLENIPGSGFKHDDLKVVSSDVHIDWLRHEIRGFALGRDS